MNPQKWDDFIQNSPQGCIYALHGYISCVRSDWQAYIVSEKGTWIGVMPFILNKKGPFSFLPQAPLTQHWGIFFRNKQAKPYANLSMQGKVIEKIAGEIAPIHLHTFNLAPDFPYALPFYWEGFELKTRFTYQLDLSIDEEILSGNREASHKRQIRKAEKLGIICAKEERIDPFETLYQLNLSKGHDLHAGDVRVLPLLKKLLPYLVETERGYISVARDGKGEVYAAAIFAYTSGKMYYLAGAYHPEHMASGAMTALLWHNILEAKALGLTIFDFEGSMIKGIEQFFRKFGALPVPYLQLYKNNLPLWAKWLHKLTS